MDPYVTLVVLNDGKTYTDVDGASLLVVTRQEYDRVIAEGGNASEFRPVVEVFLHNIFTPTERE